MLPVYWLELISLICFFIAVYFVIIRYSLIGISPALTILILQCGMLMLSCIHENKWVNLDVVMKYADICVHAYNWQMWLPLQKCCYIQWSYVSSTYAAAICICNILPQISHDMSLSCLTVSCWKTSWRFWIQLLFSETVSVFWRII